MNPFLNLDLILPINLKSVITSGLTVDQYVYLYLKTKHPHLISDIQDNIISYESFNELMEHFDGDLSSIGNAYFNMDNFETLFNEFRERYPRKTPNGRMLHTDLKNCILKYKRILSDGYVGLHQDILKGIDLEIEAKQRNNSLNYLRLMKTYLNQRGWEEYMPNLEVKREKLSGEDIV